MSDQLKLFEEPPIAPPKPRAELTDEEWSAIQRGWEAGQPGASPTPDQLDQLRDCAQETKWLLRAFAELLQGNAVIRWTDSDGPVIEFAPPPG